MKQFWILVACLAICCAKAGVAEQIKTFIQAQELSAQSGRPILLEFVHEN
jgi:hypothetical protein